MPPLSEQLWPSKSILMPVFCFCDSEKSCSIPNACPTSWAKLWRLSVRHNNVLLALNNITNEKAIWRLGNRCLFLIKGPKKLKWHGKTNKIRQLAATFQRLQKRRLEIALRKISWVSIVWFLAFWEVYGIRCLFCVWSRKHTNMWFVKGAKLIFFLNFQCKMLFQRKNQILTIPVTSSFLQ